MKNKLKCVLLVDDDEATNFLNTMILEKAEFAEKIVVAKNGKEALDILSSRDKNSSDHPVPDLILLDINMPIMNGWDFLNHYHQLQPQLKAKTVLIMLTTSLNPEDKEKAETNPDINGFENKPLNNSKLENIISGYFPEETPG